MWGLDPFSDPFWVNGKREGGPMLQQYVGDWAAKLLLLLLLLLLLSRNGCMWGRRKRNVFFVGRPPPLISWMLLLFMNSSRRAWMRRRPYDTTVYLLSWETHVSLEEKGWCICLKSKGANRGDVEKCTLFATKNDCAVENNYYISLPHSSAILTSATASSCLAAPPPSRTWTSPGASPLRGWTTPRGSTHCDWRSRSCRFRQRRSRGSSQSSQRYSGWGT